jgi:DNA mismatch repair protein MutL
MYNETFGVQIQNKKEDALVVENYSFADSKNFANRPNISMFEEEEKIPNYKYCGAVFSTYIIIEMKNEMYIIDQHAAHERIMYENIKKNFYSDLEKESQIMLLPDIITLSHKEKQIVKENKDLFKKAGFIIEEFGENTIRLIGVPAICMQLDTKELFLEILDTIDTVAITAKQEKEDKFIATIACKAAVKANMNLTKEEVDSLMKKLLVLPNPFTCPHGRPTAIKMDKMDLERKFSRRK